MDLSAILGSCGCSAEYAVMPPELDNLPPPRVRPIWSDDKEEEKDPPTIGSFKDFEYIRFIGSGVIGTVILVRCKGNGQLYAMKLVPKVYASETPQRKKRMMNEQYILRYSRHPFVGRLQWSFQTKEYLILVMDYYPGGTLTKLQLKQPGYLFSEEAVRFYSSQIIMALERTHKLGFLYRDVKTENLVFAKAGHIVLIDYGYAKQAATPEFLEEIPVDKREFKIKKLAPALSFVGTSQYVAPEVIDGAKQRTTVDWWSFGILLWQMLFADTPFRGVDMDDTFANIKKGVLKFPKTRPLSSQCKSLLRGLLEHKPEKRLGCGGAKEVKAHPFYAEVDWDLERYMERPPAYSLAVMQKHHDEPEDEAMDPKDKQALDDMLKEDVEIIFESDYKADPDRFKGIDVWEDFEFNVAKSA